MLARDRTRSDGVPSPVPLRAIATGLLVCAFTFTVSVFAAQLLSNATNTGFFGICGPYGDGWSLGVQALLLGGGIFGSPVAGFRAMARVRRFLVNGTAA